MQGVGAGEKRTVVNEVRTVVESSITIYSPHQLPKVQMHRAAGILFIL